MHAPFADKASCFRATPKRWAHKSFKKMGVFEHGIYRSIPLELPFYWENDDKSWGLGCQSFRQPHLISVGFCWYHLISNGSIHMVSYDCKIARWFQIWLVVWNMNFIFPLILGMSSSQLTLTLSFFRGVGLNHQPDN